MPTYDADDIFEVRIEGLITNQYRWNNVLHYRLATETETPLFDVPRELAETVFTLYATQFGPELSNDLTLSSSRCSRIYPAVGVPAVYIPSLPVGGSVTGGSLPPDVAAVLTKRTDKAGRSFLGRMYLTGIPRDSVVVDQISTVAAPGLANAGEAVLADRVTLSTNEDFDPCVFSTKLAAAGATPADASAITQTVELDRVTRNQRGRGLSFRVPVVGTE